MKTYAVAFPGQGSQYASMGKKLYGHYSVVRDLYEEASGILGYDLADICFNKDIDTLSRMDVIQPAILITSVAGYNVFIEQADNRPSFMLGHSLGEVSALVCSGVIDFKDAIRIVNLRGKLMSDPRINDGYMMVIMGLDINDVERVCEYCSSDHGIVEISNINSEEQIVISGNTSAVDKATRLIEEMGGRTMKINTGNPYHCSLMNVVKDELQCELEKYDYHKFQYPVISNVSGDLYENTFNMDIPTLLSQQLVKPVQWLKSMSYLENHKVYNIVEMMPQTIIRNIMITNTKGINVYSEDDPMDKEAIESIVKSISNPLNVSVEKKLKLIKKCVSISVSTINNNYDNESYNLNVKEPYEKLLSLQREIISNNLIPSYEDMKEGLGYFSDILLGKKVDFDTYKEAMEDVLFDSGLFVLFSEFLERYKFNEKYGQ